MRTEHHLQAPAAIQLIGSEGESAEFMLGEPSEALTLLLTSLAPPSYDRASAAFLFLAQSAIAW